ncbi:MAG: PorT family protein [Muribaculaceae bacterium]|nr:PorT family protein [Muribaculaceae bacterium]
MRKVLLLLAILTASLGCLAQTHYSANICVGAKGGIDLSRVFFTPSVKQGWPVNPTFGVAIRYIEENHFGLIGEINYVRRGWKENFEGLRFRYQKNLDYIEVPVLAHIYFGRRGRFFVNAGPQIGFRIGESTSANFDYWDTSNIPDFPNVNRRNSQMTEKVTQKIDYGISAGLGAEFNINPKNIISLEARYYFGLGNIFSAKRTDTFRASNTMYISILAGYWFRIK